MILACKSVGREDWQSQSYSVFDRQGKQLVEYGKYFTHEFLPDGVVLMSGKSNEPVNAVKISYGGAVTYQDYFKIEEYFPSGDLKGKKIYETYPKVGDEVVKELVDYYPGRSYSSFDD